MVPTWQRIWGIRIQKKTYGSYHFVRETGQYIKQSRLIGTTLWFEASQEMQGGSSEHAGSAWLEKWLAPWMCRPRLDIGLWMSTVKTLFPGLGSIFPATSPLACTSESSHFPPILIWTPGIQCNNWFVGILYCVAPSFQETAQRTRDRHSALFFLIES